MAKRLINNVITALALLGTSAVWGDTPFVDNHDGTVSDTRTGLMWDQCSWGQTNAGGTCRGGLASRHGWAAALEVAATASDHKGYSDWRLPNVIELKTLLNSAFTPNIDGTFFPNLSPEEASFWSDSSYAADSVYYAWLVRFNLGDADKDQKSTPNLVRLVRGEPYFRLSATGVSNITGTTVTLSASSAIAATGSWLVVPRDAAPPSAAQIIAGNSYGGVSVAAHGALAMAANTPAIMAISGLLAGTPYDLYVVAEESTYQTTTRVTGPISFRTAFIYSTRSIVIDPGTPAKLYAALEGAGVYRSADSGANWSAAATQPTNLSLKALVIKPGSPAILYAASDGSGVFKSVNSAVDWMACTGQPTNRHVLSLAMDATGRLYAGTEAGVFVSTDDCGTWAALNTGLPN